MTFVSAAGAQSPYPIDPPIATSDSIQLDGRTLRYTAHAGHVPIRHNETGEVRGNMFFVAYRVTPAPGAPPRPVTFSWNGGPGAASSLVHLLGWGPKRLNTADVYPEFERESQLAWSDNQGTWLGVTDLVFVDPIGTGYSRPVKAEYGPEFYNTVGDYESVAEFIRVYLTRYDGWQQPSFLAGESYGTTRAMGVAEALERREIPVAGVMLISGSFEAGQAPTPPHLNTAFSVHTRAATALWHEKLSPELQRNPEATLEEVAAWAEDVYAVALARRDGLTRKGRRQILEQLSLYVGVPVSKLDTANLTARNTFSTDLLAAEGLILGAYDSRMTRSAALGPANDVTIDPSLDDLLHPVGVLRYLRNQLGVKLDLRYQGPFGGGYPPPAEPRGDWMAMRWNRAATNAVAAAGRERSGEIARDDRQTRAAGATTDSAESPPLRRAMDMNPAMTVFVARGLYDSGGCASAAHTVRTLQAALAGRVSFGCYAGGHSFYTDKEARLRLRQDVTEFIQDSLDRARATW